MIDRRVNLEISSLYTNWSEVQLEWKHILQSIYINLLSSIVHSIAEQKLKHWTSVFNLFVVQFLSFELLFTTRLRPYFEIMRTIFLCRFVRRILYFFRDFLSNYLYIELFILELSLYLLYISNSEAIFISVKFLWLHKYFPLLLQLLCLKFRG